MYAVAIAADHRAKQVARTALMHAQLLDTRLHAMVARAQEAVRLADLLVEDARQMYQQACFGAPLQWLLCEAVQKRVNQVCQFELRTWIDFSYQTDIGHGRSVSRLESR